MSDLPEADKPTAATLTTEQVAALFDYPEQVLHLMIETGDFPAPVTVAGQYRWTPEDVARADVAIDALCRAMRCPDMPEPEAGEGGR